MAQDHLQLPGDSRSMWPIEMVESAFRLLATAPAGLSVDGTAIGHGLPQRPIPVTELRVMLLHPSTRAAAREAVWRHVIARAQTGDPAWVVAAVGMAAPGLKRLAVLLSRCTQ